MMSQGEKKMGKRLMIAMEMTAKCSITLRAGRHLGEDRKSVRAELGWYARRTRL